MGQAWGNQPGGTSLEGPVGGGSLGGPSLAGPAQGAQPWGLGPVLGDPAQEWGLALRGPNPPGLMHLGSGPPCSGLQALNPQSLNR